MAIGTVPLMSHDLQPINSDCLLAQGRAFMRALQALQIRLDCLKEGDWPSVEEETALCMALAREMTRHASLQPSQTAGAQNGHQAMQLAIVPDAK